MVPATRRPAHMSARPAPTTHLAPMRSARIAPSGVVTAAVTANGRVRTPADSAEYPRTSWKYWVMRKMKPNSAKKATEIELAPAENRLTAKTLTSSSGPGVRSSTTANTPRMARDAASSPTVRADHHDHAGP